MCSLFPKTIRIDFYFGGHTGRIVGFVELWLNCILRCMLHIRVLTANMVHNMSTYDKICVTSKYIDLSVHPPSMAMVLLYLFLDSPGALECTCDQRRLRSDCL